MSCIVCEGEPAPKLVKDGVSILQCRTCGLGWWEPGGGHDARSVYDLAYFEGTRTDRGYDDYGGLEPFLRENFERRLARLPRPEGDARLLDVGAAYGFAVAAARGRGWRAFGVELSAEALGRAPEACAGALVQGSAEALPFAPHAFDVLTLWDVLEHLRDPHAALSEAGRVLRPGGRLVLTTGDLGSLVARVSGSRWHLYTLPEHLFFYTRESLRRLLEGHGFEVRSMRAEGSVYSLGYLVERLRKTLLGSARRHPARWPGAGLRVSVNLFDIVTVEGIRTDRE